MMCEQSAVAWPILRYPTVRARSADHVLSQQDCSITLDKEVSLLACRIGSSIN